MAEENVGGEMKHIGDIGPRCCGCRSCEQVCPVNAITMVADEDGFLMPQIDESVCIQCGKCRRSCSMMNWALCGTPEHGYAAWLRDADKLNRSASGGAFCAIAETVLNNGGVVFGSANDSETGLPSVRCARNAEELEALKGSKYVQSDTSDSFTQVKTLLDEGTTVLFAGTPCQVGGLFRFLGKPYKNLLTVDLICHGVPSPKLYRAYLDWLGEKHGGTVVDYAFRSKDKHAWSLTYRATVKKPNGQTKTVERMASLTPYYHSFLKGEIYRESCYRCPYAQWFRAGDITVGDFWGIEREYPEFVNHDGVSAVLVNTEKGAALWEQASALTVAHEVDVQTIRRNQGNLNHATHRSAVRDTVYRDLNEHGFGYVAKTYMGNPNAMRDAVKDRIPGRTRQQIKRVLKKLLKR